MTSIKLLPFLLLLLTSCGYASSQQAQQACEDWAAEVPTPRYKQWDWAGNDPREGRVQPYKLRKCTLEEETNQWLGEEREDIPLCQTNPDLCQMNKVEAIQTEFKVAKNFKY